MLGTSSSISYLRYNTGYSKMVYGINYVVSYNQACLCGLLDGILTNHTSKPGNRYIYCFISKWTYKILSFIIFIYHIDHLCCIVFELHRGKPPLSTEWYDKFINFLSIDYRFYFGSIYPQEFGPASNCNTWKLIA